MAMHVERLLGCELPIQLAPMGSVSTSPALALAVARAGGHGMYPGLAMPADALEAVLRDVGDAPVGVNFLVPMLQPGALETALERVSYVDFFLALPDPALVAAVHAAGRRCGWQVETAEEARAAEAAGCDLIVAKGTESGGRKRVEGPGLLPLLDGVLDAVDVPVLAAGGIATRRGVAAVLAAGAAGVRVGTRFLVAEESDAHPVWIEAVLGAEAQDAVVSHAFNVGMPQPGPHRVLRSAVEAAERLPEDGEVGVVRMGPVDMPVARFAPTPPNRDSTGQAHAMALYAGQSAGAVRRREPAADILRELAAGLPGRAEPPAQRA